MTSRCNSGFTSPYIPSVRLPICQINPFAIVPPLSLYTSHSFLLRHWSRSQHSLPSSTVILRHVHRSNPPPIDVKVLHSYVARQNDRKAIERSTMMQEESALSLDRRYSRHGTHIVWGLLPTNTRRTTSTVVYKTQTIVEQRKRRKLAYVTGSHEIGNTISYALSLARSPNRVHQPNYPPLRPHFVQEYCDSHVPHNRRDHTTTVNVHLIINTEPTCLFFLLHLARNQTIRISYENKHPSLKTTIASF